MLTPERNEKRPGGRRELRQKVQEQEGEHCDPSTPTKRQQRPSDAGGSTTAPTTQTPLLSTPPPTPSTPLRFSRSSAGPIASASNFPTNTHLPTTTWSNSSARLVTTSPRPEPPGSACFLARLQHLVKHKSCEQIRNRASKPPGASKPASPKKPTAPEDMADFLASFGLSNDGPAPSNNGQCASVDELATRLRDALDLKTHETRAEHVSVTLELRNTVQFALSLSESENEAIENLNSVDPSMGGARSASMSVDPAGGQQATRMVAANDTLMKQSENPVLQRTVAKHILGAISERDGSHWNLRDLSRGTHGWTFTYLCRDSLQHWTRQNAKNPTKAIVGEYSEREPDPVLMSRPAFDCRGSITIAFNRSNRCISVKYDHTLMHKTVEELSKLYPTPEREYGPGYVRQQQQKTPKKSKAKDGKNKEEKPKKKKRESQAAGDENGERPKKRKKKNSGKGAPANSAQGEAAVGGQPPGQAPASGVVPFNVSPEESARRLSIARKLLSDAGVNPDTLSSDQMNIFANQSPELQKDSVSMLAKYGAERLQIIHPNNKDKSGSDQSSTSATPATQATPMTTTKELVPGSEKKGGRKRKPTAMAAKGDEASPTSRRKLGKSRLSCLNCKSRRVRCHKQRPTCAECEAESQTCEYPPQPIRKRQKKSEAVVVEDDDDEEEEQDDDDDEAMQDTEYQQDQSHMEQPPEPLDHHDSAYPEPHQPDMSYGQMPVADMLTPNAPEIANEPSYFQSASGLALPQPTMSQGSQQAMSNASGLALPQAQPYQAPEPQMMEPVAPPPTTSPNQSKRKPKGGPRRSLPAGPAGGNNNIDSPQMNVASGSWTAANKAALGNGAVNNTVPAVAAQQPARNQQRSRQANRRMPTDSPQMRDGMAQPAQQSPQMVAAMQAQARTSPFQAAGHGRTNSRQGQRAQSRTPNTDQQMTGGFHPPVQNQANDLVASSNYNDYGRYATANTTRNDQSSNRITYEPFSQQQSSAPASSSYTAYDYGRSASTTVAPSFNPSAATANQWSGGSQTRSSRSFNNDGNFGASAYGQQDSHQSNSASMRNFDMRASAQKGSGSAAAVNKQRQQAGYSQYGSQTQGQDQQMGQPGWNYFGNNNQGWM